LGEAGSGKSGVLLFDDDPFSRSDVSFAPEPIFHGWLEAIDWNPVSDLHQPVGHGEGVVKDGIVGEVAHGEVIDPPDRTGMTYPRGIDAHN
jgi:hypothetical protein